MNRILYPIFIVLCLMITPNLIAQDDTDCASFLEQPDTTNDPNCGFFDGAGRWINLCSPCGNKIADDLCVNAPTPSICELDGYSSTSSGFMIDLGQEAIGWCGGNTVFNNNMWIGFTASTNVIDLFIDVECDPGSRGFQLGIVDAGQGPDRCTKVESVVCLNGGGGGNGVTNDQTLRTTDLIPGNEYFIVIDGFAGGVCDFTINVTDGFVAPGFSTAAENPSTLCLDVLNPGEFLPIGTSQSGASVDVTVDINSGATTNLIFFWNDPNGDLITETGPADIFGNTVRGTLDGTFFTQPGTYSVQIVDLGSCCPICAEVELTIGDPPPAAAAAIEASTVTGLPELNCFNESLLLRGEPEELPFAEQWLIENFLGERVVLQSHLVAAQGRLDEITIDRDIIETYYPGQLQGEVRVVYGFTTSFEQPCFGEAAVVFPFDYREPDINISNPDMLDCDTNPEVTINASNTNTNNHDATFMWEASDGVSSVANPDTDMPTVSNSGFYRVTVTDTRNGCVSVDSVEVLGMVDPPILGMIEDITLNCDITSEDVSTTGTANDPIDYSWTGPVDLSGESNPALTDISEEGTYTLTAVNTVNQCRASTSFNITIEMPTIAVTEVRDSSLSCDVSEVTFPAAIPSGGVGPYTYSWVDDNMTEVSTDSVLIADTEGTYTLTVIDVASGCSSVPQSTFLGSNSDSPVIGMLPDSLVIDCRNSMVSAIADATDANGDAIPGLEYEWTLDGDATVLANTNNIDFNAEGTYNILVTDPATGCFSGRDVVVVENMEMPDALIMDPVALNCIDLTTMLQGGSTTTATLSYQWYEGSDDVTGTALGMASDQEVNAAGEYALVITNEDNGCTMLVTTTVEEDMMDPTADAGMDQVLTCLNEDDGVMLDGSASALAAMGMGPLSYAWTGPNGPSGTTDVINVTEEGMYTLVVTDDANGCTMMTTVEVTTNKDAPANVTVNDGTLSCDDDEFILEAMTTTMGNLGYAWVDGGMNDQDNPTSTLSVSGGGEFTVTITNLDNGCESQATGTVMTDNEQPNVIGVVIDGLLEPLSCNNPEIVYEGQLLEPSLLPTVTFVWTDPNGDEVPGGNRLELNENSIPGQYTITATNNVNGCDASSTVGALFNFAIPDVEVTGGTILCAPNDQVTLTGTSLDGVDVSYAWSDPNMMELVGQSPVVSEPGDYTVVATSSATGCDTTLQITVEDNNDEPIIAVGQDFELTCRDGEDTYALGGSGSAANGSDPVTFSWALNSSEISTDPNFVVSEEGIYELTVTNMLTGCVATETVEVTDATTMPIATALVQSELNCNNPMVMLEGDSDDANATYEWTSVLTNEVVMGQNPMVADSGLWNLVITSENGCTATNSARVLADFAAPENVSITGDNQLNCTVPSVQLFANPEGMGETYEWTLNGAVVSDEIMPNFGAAGVYTLTVTGTNGCMDTADFEIFTDEDRPEAMAMVENSITCVNETTNIFGSSTAENTQYFWSGPPGFPPAVTTQDITTSVPGEYTLSIIDEDNNCPASFTIIVLDEREDPAIMAEGTEVVCDPDVVTEVSVSTGVANAIYEWTGPNMFTSDMPSAAVTQDGAYTVTVTNPLNGCSRDTTVMVTDGKDTPDVETDVDVLMLTCDFPISNLSASSMTPGVEFTWNGPGINNEETTAIMVDQAGDYRLDFVDPSNGCADFILLPIEIDTTAPMAVGATPGVLDCNTDQVSLNVDVVEEVTYSWDGPGLSSDPSAVIGIATEPGLYSVTVTAIDNGCESVETIFVDTDVNLPEAVANGSEITCQFQTIELLGDGSTESLGGNISYMWTGPGGFNATDLNTTTDVPGQYILTVFNSDNQCMVSDTVMITQDVDQPIADAGMPADFACADEFVTLSAADSEGQGDLSYEWTNSAGAIVGTGVTIDVTESGTFTVVVTDSDNGCTNTATVEITPDENKPDIVIADPATLTCGVSSVDLDASGTTGVGSNLTYVWTLNDNMIGTDPTIPVNAPGLYTLVVTDDSNGCSEMMSIPVDINDTEPTFEIAGGEIDCGLGQTDVILSNVVATNPTYSWTGPGTFTADTKDLIGVTIPGSYTVIVMDGDNGCTFEDTAIVTENADAPPASIDFPEELDCDTEQIQIIGQAPANLTYSWTGPGIISGGNTLTPTVNVAGEYILEVTDPSNQCSNVAVVDVIQNPNMITDINPAGNPANCFGPNTGSVMIGSSQVTGGTAPYMYSIDGGETFTTQENFLGLTAGDYEVVVMDINGCEFARTITVNPAVDLALDLGENIVLAFGDSINLNPVTNFDIAEAIWSDTLLMGNTPNVKPVSTTTYEINAFDADGCPISDQITIFVEKTRPVYIPSGFSPNLDGTNDVFTVYADLDLITLIKDFAVYDRWGEQVFFREEMTPVQALEIMNGWDGRFRDEDMNPGVYVYQVLVEFIDGEEIFYEGDVTLVR